MRIALLILFVLACSSCRVRKVEKQNITKDSTAAFSKDSVHVIKSSTRQDSFSFVTYDKETTIYFNPDTSRYLNIMDSFLNATRPITTSDYWMTNDIGGDHVFMPYVLSSINKVVIKEKYNAQTETSKQQIKFDSAVMQQEQTTSMHEEVNTKTVDAKPDYTWCYILALVFITIVIITFVVLAIKNSKEEKE